jgi:hypothetical protein
MLLESHNRVRWRVPIVQSTLMTKQQPKTKQEIEADIENHPERGKIDGDAAVRFDSVEIRGTLPRELYRHVLQAGAAQGLNKSEILKVALRNFVIESLPLTQHWQQSKSEKYDIPLPEVQSKSYGAYKDRSRKQKISRLGEDQS